MGIGRPTGSKNRKYSYDLKLMVVKDHQDNHLSWKELAMKYGVYRSVIQRWVKLYNEGILETGRIQNRGNPYAALHTSKSLTREEKLELEKGDMLAIILSAFLTFGPILLILGAGIAAVWFFLH